MNLAIRGRLAIYFDSNLKLHIIKDPLVLVEGNSILDIDSFSKLKKEISNHDIIGDENQLIIPGLINCHTHLAMTLFRGLADDLPLDIWLRKHIWPLEDKLQANDVYVGAKLGAIESLLAGVTTLNSMYWYPSSEAQAFEETGLRGMIGAPVITGIAELPEAIEVIEKHHNTIQDRLRVSLSLHSPYTVTIPDFQGANDYLKEYNESQVDKPKILLHTHLAESENEIEQSQKLHKEHGIEFPEVSTPTELLESTGILSEYLLAAHCIHVNENDIKILEKNKVRVSLNPLSNAKLGNFMPPVPKIITDISSVGLGTDGPASNNTLDLFDTIRFLALYYKGFLHNPTLIKAQEVFQLATIGGARALNWRGIGTLEPGSLADIITINLKKPHLTPKNLDDSILNHFAYAMNGNDVENVVVDGKVVVKENEILRLDVDQSINEVEEATNRLLS
ncbi:MAG: amidohydrolase [Asgard group archaeon]|nr:amidohydrolase [Asgard group archaeon]